MWRSRRLQNTALSSRYLSTIAIFSRKKDAGQSLRGVFVRRNSLSLSLFVASSPFSWIWFAYWIFRVSASGINPTRSRLSIVCRSQAMQVKGLSRAAAKEINFKSITICHFHNEKMRFHLIQNYYSRHLLPRSYRSACLDVCNGVTASMQLNQYKELLYTHCTGVVLVPMPG